MRGIALAITILLGTLAAAAAAPLQDGGVTIQDIADVMRSKGYPATLTTDRDGDPLIHSETIGIKFDVYFYECNAQKRCQSIQFYTNWAINTVNPTQIGEWNRTKRFGRAYLDRNQHPAVEMDVDLEHGATVPAIANDFERWVLVMKTFRKYIGQGE